jgi:hypothetical protein
MERNEDPLTSVGALTVRGAVVSRPRYVRKATNKTDMRNNKEMKGQG